MKKNILFIIHRMREGGAQKAAAGILNGLPKDDYNKYIYIFDNTDCQYAIDATIIDGKSPDTKHVFRKVSHFYHRYRQLKEAKRGMDVCVSFLGIPNLLNVLTRSKNSMTILSERNYLSGMNYKANFLYKSIARVCYNYADAIVCVTEPVREDLITHYKIKPHKAVVINNFIEPAVPAQKAAQEEFAFKKDVPYILCAGRLHRNKGFNYAIEGFAALNQSDVKLLIIGEGEERNRLQQLISELDMDEQIKLVGYQNNPFPFYDNALFFVLSSLVEGFPNVIMEAMACGKSVIAADCLSGPREILQPLNNVSNAVEYGQYGILVPGILKSDQEQVRKEKTQRLTEGMKKLIEDETMRIHYEKQSEKRMKDYSKDAIIKEWEAIINKERHK